MTTVKLEALDEQVINYLSILWKSQTAETDNQETVATDNQETAETDNQETVETDNQETTETDNQQTKFKKYIKENLAKLREVGFRVYHNVSLEKEVNLVPKTVTTSDINNVCKFKHNNKIYRKNLIKDISRCIIFPKYKNGDVTKPESFRYLINHHNTIKILDRLWCIELINKIGDNIPNKQIYKASLINRFNESISKTAIENTETIDSVVLLDIERAFDSLEWDVLEDLLISNLTRKTNSNTAKELVEQFIIILRNREFYYNDKPVKISKGISTGLPSSNLVFTLAIEEIIHRWFYQTNYENNKEFIMNVYVDDIYLKFINKEQANTIVNSLIQFLLEYKLNINKSKCKTDAKLNIDIPNKLKPTDFYLGIPFTRNINLYGQIILKEFQTKKLNWNWKQIYDELNKDNSKEDNVLENQRIIIGFMNYKLRPFLNKNSDKSIKEQITEFIFVNWLKSDNIKVFIVLFIIFIILFLRNMCISNNII
jgi:hypothetical protein